MFLKGCDLKGKIKKLAISVFTQSHGAKLKVKSGNI